MSELSKKVNDSIERIKSFAPIAERRGGYYVAFSGGKDSITLKALMDMSGVKYEAAYRVTTVDPPELVSFIKEKHKDVKFSTPRYKDGSNVTMWNLIAKKVNPPLRQHRFCCEYLKEDAGDGRLTVTGVRWAESLNRNNNQGVVTVMEANANTWEEFRDGNPNFKQTPKRGFVLVNDNAEARRTVEQCVIRGKTVLNPIIDWTDSEIWEFIRSENIPYCGLYDEGFHRLGCIGCPMATRRMREREFYRWPKYKTLYMLAFQKMLDIRKAKGLKERNFGTTPEDVFNWWLEYDELPGQINIFETEGIK